MCLYPRLIKNRKYFANKKNGGVIPVCQDERTKTVPVGCGKCIECRKQKSREWQIRLMEEVRQNKNGKFITLTFSNEQLKYLIEGKDTDGKQISKPIKELTGYELDNEIATIATRRFLERWRKEYKTSIKHWLITEIGHNGTENIHLHGIIWTNEPMEKIEKHWKYGWIWKGKKENGTTKNYVNEQTINYIVKYMTKTDNKHKEYKPKILTSAGIGKQYTERIDSKLNKYNGTNTNECYKTRTGHKIIMPVYWRNKIYTEEEREKLWLQKLDKKERWILGEKIDISNGEEEYYKALNYARNKNKRLGYGNDEKNWERKHYENERRKLKMAERTKRPADTHTPSPAIAPGSSYNEKTKIMPNKNWDQ